MNKAILVGRLTRAVDVRYTQGNEPMAIAKGSIAVDRVGKNAEGADFVSITAFGKRAEFLEKYTNKGTKLAIVGHIHTDSYTNKDGAKVYTTEVIIDECEFAESKNAGSNEAKPEPATDNDGFMNVPEGIDDLDLPFAPPSR